MFRRLKMWTYLAVLLGGSLLGGGCGWGGGGLPWILVAILQEDIFS
jgi:hypothetical protein